jgi:hypothetical protein
MVVPLGGVGTCKRNKTEGKTGWFLNPCFFIIPGSVFFCQEKGWDYKEQARAWKCFKVGSGRFFLAYPVCGDVLLSADSEGFLRRKSKKRPCRRDGSGRALHSKTTPARRLFLKKQRG